MYYLSHVLKVVKLILLICDVFYKHSIIPSGDVLATVLALYMHDKEQPLPRQEEVLICTHETTAEEVIISNGHVC